MDDGDSTEVEKTDRVAGFRREDEFILGYRCLVEMGEMSALETLRLNI